MNMNTTLFPWMVRMAKGLGLALAASVLAGCERPIPESLQSGYRGTGMAQVYNARLLEVKTEKNQPPVAIPSAGPTAPRPRRSTRTSRSGQLSVGEFNRLMVSMTSWVAPNEGCAYCHALPNFEDDSKYTKVVARRMVEMTQHINADWQPHVAQTGVTCYTCHRGEPVPSAIWFKPTPALWLQLHGRQGGTKRALTCGQFVLFAQRPVHPVFAGQAKHPCERPHRAAIGQPPVDQASRVDLWPDDAHVDLAGCELHLLPQHAVLPELGKQPTTTRDGLARHPHGAGPEPDLHGAFDRSLPGAPQGPLGDVAKLNCATCHQGAYKPLNGAPMAKDFPELLKPALAASKVAAK
jgi:photosynthetic reaction center cytochrome c subunit